MTMQLSNQFEKQRQAFLDAVANGAPQEEQAKLYNDMIESMTNEMMAQARNAAREEVSALNPYMPNLLQKLVSSSMTLKKLHLKESKNSSHKKQLTVSLKIWLKRVHCFNISVLKMPASV